MKVLGQYKGVCQDSLVGGTDDNQLHTAVREDGINVITYRRQLDSGKLNYFIKLYSALYHLINRAKSVSNHRYWRGIRRCTYAKLAP